VDTKDPQKRQPASPPRKLVWLLVRLGVAGAGLAWTLNGVAFAELSKAAQKVTLPAFALATALFMFIFLVGAVRWRLLMSAYGARRLPSLALLYRVNHIGLFYNTFIPGNIGGDVLRGYVTRRAFSGQTGSYVVVGVERFFGLAGLMVLGAAVISVHPIGGISNLPWAAVGAVLLAVGVAVAPMVLSRFGRFFPGRLQQLVASLPAVHVPWLLAIVLLLSCGTQTVVALIGHTLVHSIAPCVALGDSLVLVPIAMIAVYFPFTIAGLGVREAAFVVLFTEIGVTRPDATAGSLAFLAVQLLVALLGGLCHVLVPVRTESEPPAGATAARSENTASGRDRRPSQQPK
jgi:uncharacterized membrane protein YbhN (UPF0104 family)